MYRAGSARGLFLALNRAASRREMALVVEALSCLRDLLTIPTAPSATKSPPPPPPPRLSSSGISPRPATNVPSEVYSKIVESHPGTVFAEQRGIETLLTSLNCCVEESDHQWAIASLCIQIIGIQLSHSATTLSRPDFLKLSQNSGLVSLLKGPSGSRALRLLLDIALGLPFNNHKVPVDLLPAEALFLQKPKAMILFIQLLSSCSDALLLAALRSLASFSSSKSTLHCHRNCDALASIHAVNELLDSIPSRSLLRFLLYLV